MAYFRISYTFKSLKLPELAMTHSSFANDKGRKNKQCNERLEFLGDAILDAVITEKLYVDYPELSEGEMTKLRASLVCESNLAKKAKECEVSRHIKLGSGFDRTLEPRISILADAFEALLGAVFIDGGFEAVKTVVHDLFRHDIVMMRDEVEKTDSKSFLQEELQKKSTEIIKYRLMMTEGPPHDRQFYIEASYEGRAIGTGTGKTKKEAEQNAAKDAIERLGLNNDSLS